MNYPCCYTRPYFLVIAAAIFLAIPSVSVASSKKSKLPDSISVTSDNQLDFLDVGSVFGKFSVVCRVSTAEPGTVRTKKNDLMWSSFQRDELKLKKKRRKARKQDKRQKAKKLRKKLKNIQQANIEYSTLCFQAISDLGVTPRPSPTPDSSGGNPGGGTGGGNPGGGGTPNPSPTPTPDPSIDFPGAGFAPVRINGGGPTDFLSTPQYTDSQGNTWLNDTFFSGVQNYFHAKIPVLGTTDQEIWMSERYGPAFSYQIPVLSGAAKYVVVLHLGEIFWEEANQRVFDVYVEGQQVVFNLDLITSVGFNLPSVQTFEATVSDGVLNIDFFGVTQYAKVNGVEVLGHPTQYDPLF